MVFMFIGWTLYMWLAQASMKDYAYLTMKKSTGKIVRCRNGHRRTEDNTYTRPDGYEACRDCIAAADKRYRERQKKEKELVGHER